MLITILGSISLLIMVKSAVSFFYYGRRSLFAFTWMPVLVCTGWFLAERYAGDGQGLIVGMILLFAIIGTYIIDSTNYGG